MFKENKLSNEMRKCKDKETRDISLDDATLEAISRYILEKSCENIIVLTGAGLSTSAGLPDVSLSEKGLYFSSSTPAKNAHLIFTEKLFRTDPVPLYKFYRDFMLNDFKPTLSHFFIALIERKNLLLKNYTMNMDDLEKLAGVSEAKLAQVYGTFNRYRCSKCDIELSFDMIKEAVGNGELPLCYCGNVLKPKVIMYGEPLPKAFLNSMAQDFMKCDLLIILGTSMSDEPIASMPFFVHNKCPRLVINKTIPSKSLGFSFKKPKTRDVLWIGECDSGCKKLAEYLGWSDDLTVIIEDTLNMNL